ncbi:MAG: nitroreductase family protein [Desulfitobacterium hafniense]|nr:nitroreductase family protein [Desulfitobacterium hafniense]
MLELLKKRRSIRKFEVRNVEKEKIDQLIKAALLSPSSRRLRPWEFIVVENRETLKKLAGARQGAAFLDNAPLAIVVVADPDKCDVWVEDSSIATIIIQLTAESLGLGSCWIQIRERVGDSGQTAEDYVRGELSIPSKLKVESIVAIGYPAETKAPNDESSLKYEKVYSGEYGNKY